MFNWYNDKTKPNFWGAFFSVTFALPKLLALGNEKKNGFSFCISLVFS